jgi:hypothetical protein
MYLRQYSGSPEIPRIGFRPDFIGSSGRPNVSSAPLPTYHQHQQNVSLAPAQRITSTGRTFHQHQPELIG